MNTVYSNINLSFVTFANTAFMTPDRILKQAEEFGVFKTITAYTEHSIPDFIEKHKDFINVFRHGYGRYIWKPKVILSQLEKMNTNDCLVYCDAGMYLNKNGLPRFRDYISMLYGGDKDMITFSLNDQYKAHMFISCSAIVKYNPGFIWYPPSKYCYAGVMMMRKTDRVIEFIKDWLALCEDYSLLCPTRTCYEHPEFQGGDSDNGLFNLVLLTKQISHDIYPDETNVYLPDGHQYYGCTDWSSLDDFPFQYRRIRPK